MIDLNGFIASENNKLYQVIRKMELDTIRSIREQVSKQYGFSQNTKVENNGKEYTVNFIKYDDKTVYMELVYQERTIYYYDNAPVTYDTCVLRVNLKDFKDFKVVNDDISR